TSSGPSVRSTTAADSTLTAPTFTTDPACTTDSPGTRSIESGPAACTASDPFDGAGFTDWYNDSVPGSVSATAGSGAATSGSSAASAGRFARSSAGDGSGEVSGDGPVDSLWSDS